MDENPYKSPESVGKKHPGYWTKRKLSLLVGGVAWLSFIPAAIYFANVDRLMAAAILLVIVTFPFGMYSAWRSQATTDDERRLEKK